MAGLAIGGGLGITSGVLYFLASGAASEVFEPDPNATQAELLAARSRANMLVIGSAATGGLAGVVGLTSLMSDTGPGIGIKARW